MLKRIAVLAFVLLFAVGIFAAMADDGSGCKDKNALQCMYNWFNGCERAGEKTAKNTCMACGKACCKTCQTNCGGQCCAKCGKK